VVGWRREAPPSANRDLRADYLRSIVAHAQIGVVVLATDPQDAASTLAVSRRRSRG
jgi:hypothetical protein